MVKMILCLAGCVILFLLMILLARLIDLVSRLQKRGGKEKPASATDDVQPAVQSAAPCVRRQTAQGSIWIRQSRIDAVQ